MKRPIGVTILAVFTGLLALLALVMTLQFLGLFPWLGPGPDVRTFNLWYALLYGLLTYVWLWVTQMLLTLNYTAWIFAVVITIFNLTVNLVAIIGGTPAQLLSVSIILNGLILIYAMLPGTRRAFEPSREAQTKAMADARAAQAEAQAAQAKAAKAAPPAQDPPAK